MILLTGAGTGLTSGLLMKLLRLVQHTSYRYRTGDFLSGVRNVSGRHRVEIMVLAGILGGLALYGLRKFEAGKAHGVTGAVWKRNGALSPAPTLLEALISIVIVGMGAAVGREAALKDAGAVVAERLSAWTGLTPSQRRLLVACGAGAGMAAAYNVPLGGALFAAEVLLGSLSLSNVLAAVATSSLAVWVSWTMLPNAPTFSVAPLALSGSLLTWAVLAGPLIGAASAVYVRVIAWAEAGAPKGWRAIAAPIAVFAALGVLAVWFPEVLGNGKNVVQQAFSSRIATPLLCWLLILRPLATALCLKAGTPGGLFTPTMTFGALLGGLLGQAWSFLAPNTSKDTYAIVGAGAMLAAASQGPISSIVFMLELTNHTDSLIVPLLIAVVGAAATARRMDPRSIYSVRG
jgi:CIC family chloride channel protein